MKNFSETTFSEKVNILFLYKKPQKPVMNEANKKGKTVKLLFEGRIGISGSFGISF